VKKIRLGVVLDQQIRAGGGYQQMLNGALLAKQLPAEFAEVVFYTTIKKNIKILHDHGISVSVIKFSLISKLRTYFYRVIKNSNIFKLLRFIEKNNPHEKVFLKDKIDLVYFLSPSSWPIDLEKINYITTVWDLSHRDDPEFPEVRWQRKFETRENNYREILPRATAILVDSDLARSNLVRRYGIDKERIYLMPFQGAVEILKQLRSKNIGTVDIRNKYQLNVPYVFYPAQFWAHKNHIYLLEGLKYLEQDFGLHIGAIFSGGDFGNLDFIRKNVAKLGLSGRVRFTDFVANEEMLELYRQSLALVMPTYFGPTNLPPLEAFEIGIPVLYSDKDGLRDQVGDAALLMDLKNSRSMARQLKNLIEDKQLRQRLIEAGRKKLDYFNSFDRLAVLKSIIENFSWKRKCWK
jgi:glycosyltransferase involved in cell wall biosynthesis